MCYEEIGNMSEREVVILGGGLTGISAAMHLRRPWVLLEKNDRLGGHARTDEREGHWFDKTGHWLHLRDPYTQKLIADLLGDRMVRVERRARVFSNAVLTRFPFQANLHGLPPDVAKECLLGFIQAWQRKQAGALPAPANFEVFIEQNFGPGIARHFMIPYNHKLWGVHPREITAEWCTRFVPIPTLDDVVQGAVGANPPEMGYNISFLYPKEGGIETMTRALASRIDSSRGEVRVGTALEVLDAEARTVTVGGETIPYRAVVATLPLPELLSRTRGLPADVEAAAAQLRCTPVRYLNVGTRRPVAGEFHWIYVPEEKYPFYRVGIYSNALPAMAPAGLGSLYVELSDRGPVPTGTARDALTRDVAQALAAAGALAAPDDLLFADLHELRYAYVVFDDNYYPATERIRAWLESQNIFPRGRYGFWTYNAMEDCILAGREVIGTIDRRLAEKHGHEKDAAALA
jgi:protoporphyrinogen oxidase